MGNQQVACARPHPMPLLHRPWAVRAAAVIGANLLLCAAAGATPAAGSGDVPALYPNQAEAEKAARLHFNCTCAHKMGDQWMPCAKHADSYSSAPSH